MIGIRINLKHVVMNMQEKVQNGLILNTVLEGKYSHVVIEKLADSILRQI